MVDSECASGYCIAGKCGKQLLTKIHQFIIPPFINHYIYHIMYVNNIVSLSSKTSFCYSNNNKQCHANQHQKREKSLVSIHWQNTSSKLHQTQNEKFGIFMRLIQRYQKYISECRSHSNCKIAGTNRAATEESEEPKPGLKGIVYYILLCIIYVQHYHINITILAVMSVITTNLQ